MARVPQPIRMNNISQVAPQGGQRGAGWAVLADVTKSAVEFIRPAAEEQAQEAGLNAVYRDENGQLKIDEFSPLSGELGQVANAAAYAKFLSQRQIDMRDTFTELAIHHQFDPDGFRQAADDYVSTLQSEEGVPDVLREELVGAAQNESSARFNGLLTSQIDRTQRDAARSTAAQRDMLADDYINLTIAGDQEGAARIYTEMQGLTDFRASAPYINETAEEGEAYLRGARGAAQATQLTQILTGLEGASSISDDQREQIQALLDDPDISPQTRVRLYEATQGRLQGIDGRAAADALARQDVDAAVRNYGWDTNGAQQVVDAGAGYTVMQLSDGSVVRREGTRAWRNNNPGNIEYGDFARAHGAVGTDGRFAVFPDYQAGRDAKAALIFESGSYRNLSISAAISRYAPAFENDTQSYARQVAGAAGVPLSTPMSALNAEQRVAVLDAMERVEGFREGTEQVVSGSGTGAPPDMNQVRADMAEAGVPMSAGSQFVAGVFGVEAADALFNADPTAMAADVLDPALIEANPAMSNMTVEQARNWAERQGTVKASDIAARRTQVDQIADPEVRAIAASALNQHYDERRRMETVEQAEYEERLQYQDDTLTEREILSNHNLSDSAQSGLISELRRQRRDQIEVQNTLADIADDSTRWDIYDSSQRNRVDNAYKSMLGDEAPMTPNGMVTGAQIAQRTGFVPRTLFNSLRAAVTGNDPESFATAMEFSDNLLRRQPNAMAPYDGDSDVTKALADYQFYSSLFGAEDAAARVLADRSPENQGASRIHADVIRESVKELDVSDFADHMGSLGVEVNVESPAAGAFSSDYERLFRSAMADPAVGGSVDMARNRALTELSRIYGPNTLNGSNQLMRYPPQNFYPAIAGSQDWMRRDLAEWVSGQLREMGEFEEETAIELTARAISPFGSNEEVGVRRALTNTTLISDAQTQRDIAAGRAPSYTAYYLSSSGEVVSFGGRIVFEPPSPSALGPDFSRLQERHDARIQVQQAEASGDRAAVEEAQQNRVVMDAGDREAAAAMFEDDLAGRDWADQQKQELGGQ